MNKNTIIIRSILTVIILIVIAALNRITMPFIDLNGAIDELGGNPDYYYQISFFQKTTIFALKLIPLITGASVVLFFTGLIPGMNTKRLKDIRRTIAIPSMILVLAVALLQSNYTSKMLLAYGTDSNIFSLKLPVMQFKPVLLGWLTGGFLFLLFLLRFIRTHGIGLGLATFMFLTAIFPTVETVKHFFNNEHTSVPIKIGGTIAGIFFVSLVSFLIFAKKEIPLYTSDKKSKTSLPIRLNLLGYIPLVLSGLLPFCVFLPLTWLADRYEFFEILEENITEVYGSNFILFMGLIIIAVSILLFLLHYPVNNLAKICKKYNVAPAIDKRTLLNYYMIAGISNCLMLILLLTLSMNVFGEYFKLFPPIQSLIILLLIGAKIVGALKNPTIPCEESETIVEEFDTVLEARLCNAHLQEKGITSRVINTRFMEFTGTSAPWENCRPLFLALSVNPFLDNGSVTVVVAKEQYDEAQAIIEGINSSVEGAPLAP